MVQRSAVCHAQCHRQRLRGGCSAGVKASTAREDGRECNPGPCILRSITKFLGRRGWNRRKAAANHVTCGSASATAYHAVMEKSWMNPDCRPSARPRSRVVATTTDAAQIFLLRVCTSRPPPSVLGRETRLGHVEVTPVNRSRYQPLLRWTGSWDCCRPCGEKRR